MYAMRINAAIVLASGLLCSAAVKAGQDKSGKTVWDAVYNEAQSKRGETAYGQYCAKSHGPDLMGADVAPPFERLQITMPGDKPGTVSRQDNADIVAFLLSKNGFPAGQADLPAQTEIMKTIKILTQKP